MGRIRANASYFLDLASEEIACSSGILLSDKNIDAITKRHDIDDLQGLSRNGGEMVLRAEEFEMAVLNIRVAIGNLPDAEMGQFVLLEACRALFERGVDATKICEAYIAVSVSGKYTKLTDEATEEIVAISGAAPRDVYEVLIAVGDMQHRQMNFYDSVSRAVWNSRIPLNRLFEAEHVPDNPDVYLDQRYIDYLAKNSEDMNRIYWRNFERLTTEFFKRQGYEVNLGPGTKDGGVDVRVWTDREAKYGPPLMLIQCKRYKGVIGIETIKAFWSDVHFEGAKKGLIATTSSISRDSKALCEARKWPMTFAESDEVHRWARSMWRLKPDIRRSHGRSCQ